MKCYRKLLRISWTQKVTNTERHENIGQKDNLLQTVTDRKLRLFGHIQRKSNDWKLKVLLFGKLDGRTNTFMPGLAGFCRRWFKPRFKPLARQKQVSAGRNPTLVYAHRESWRTMLWSGVEQISRNWATQHGTETTDRSRWNRHRTSTGIKPITYDNMAKISH